MTAHPDLLREFADALRPRLSGELRLDVVSRGLYATDASMYEVMPVGVLLPRHADDVQAAVTEASRFGIPVLARGGGSSLAGQTVNQALVIDFSRHLDAVLETDADEGRVRVQPGITLTRLNAHLASTKWMVGPDPASGDRATLGGMLANNSTGTHSILYGNMIRHVLAARAVLADGSSVVFDACSPSVWAYRASKDGPEGHLYEALGVLAERHGKTIRQEMPSHWRRASGYRLEALLEPSPNLARLLCGSEGTLAVVTDLTIDLVLRPKRTVVGAVHYPTRTAALESVERILETEPSAVELFDGETIAQCRRAPGFAPRMSFIRGKPGAVLLTEYYVASEAEAHEALHALGRATDGEIVSLVAPDEIANAWGVRREALGMIMNVRGDHKPLAFVEDASVPVSELPSYIRDLSALLDETGTRSAMYAHASAGCLHVRPFINTKDAAEVERMRDLAAGSADLVRRYGGWVSSEHGDGLVRSWLNPSFLGEHLYGLCREVKQLFDRDGTLNPGRVVDAPAMTEHLRLGPDYRAVPVLTDLNFDAEGGFSGAVEQCNGNGACRKLDSGALCPSFMATREEEHSTRGRANLLRMALGGRLGDVGWQDDRIGDALALCVQCKACKTECPSSVDMAKIKTEWLNQHWRTHRIPLRTRVFAYLPVAARQISGPLARFANRWMTSRIGKSVIGRVLGIHPNRKLPEFAPVSFAAWARTQVFDGTGAAVVLFVDTFHNYQQPEVARAAASFLHEVGYRVIPVADVCCGRTYLSKGLVTAAHRTALATVDRLHPYAIQGLPVVGLEPSCVLTLLDEFVALLPGDPRSSVVARAAQTFEQFVASEADAGRLDHVRWRAEPPPIHVHGHCHQRALTGMSPSVRCLSVTGATVHPIDAGCCGMAGAFGYEKEHYAVSVAMAENRLAPAVRAAPDRDVIAAAGTSCRAQIRDVTGRSARHPAEVLLDALNQRPR